MRILFIFLVIPLLLFLPNLFLEKPPTGETTHDLQAPDDVKISLRNACYDCHSFETRYPIYSNIFPISLIVYNHIREGREELNFSEFELLSESKKTSRLKSIVEDIETGEMPLFGYTLLHSEARWTEDEKKKVIDWANSLPTEGEEDEN